MTYDGNPSRKRFIDLLFRNKNKEVSTLVVLDAIVERSYDRNDKKNFLSDPDKIGQKNKR